jgi:hypothetical protein
MWASGAHQFLLNTLNIPLTAPGGESLQLALMILAGLFFSLLLLFANDWRKRYQGYILIAGTAVVLLVLNVFGIGLFTENITLLNAVNIGGFIVGLIIGLMTELRENGEGDGGDLTKIDFQHEDSSWANWITTESGRQTPAEFPIAYKGLVGLIVAVVSIANVFNVMYNQNIGEVAVHTIASLILLYSLYSLLDINVEKSEEETSEVQFEVLGPQQSGKTYLALGLNLSIKNNDAYEIGGFDGRMPDIVEEHSNRITGKVSGLIDWGIGNTMIDAAEKVIIEFKKTDKKRGEVLAATVNMYDYPGEVLEDLADEYNEKRGKKMTDGGESSNSDDNDQEQEEETKDDLGTIDQITGKNDTDKESSNQITSESTEADIQNHTRAIETGNEESVKQGDDNSEVENADSSSTAGDNTNGENPLGTLGDIPVDDQSQDQSSKGEKDETSEPGTQRLETEDTDDPIWGDNRESSDESKQVVDDDEDADTLGDSPNQSDGSMQDSIDIDPDEIDKVKNALAKNVGAADKLVVLLDSQRFLTQDDIIKDDPGMMLKEMTQIVQGAGPDEIIPVATKADYFMKEYEDLSTGTLPTEEEMEEFSKYVNKKFDNHPMAGNLLELADYPVFPVYFLTGKGKDGGHKLRVKDGRIHPIGYEKLIDVVTGK